MRQRIINWLKANYMPFNDGLSEVFIVQRNQFMFIYDLDHNEMSLSEKLSNGETVFLLVDQDDAYELIIEIFEI